MIQSSGHQQQLSEGADRTNRFLGPNGQDLGTSHLRERAASQPPRGSASVAPALNSSLSGQQGIPVSRGAGDDIPRSPWTPRTPSTLNPHAPPPGMPQSFPTRSSSYSGAAHAPPMQQSTHGGAFGPPREDDEDDEAFGDTYDETYVPTPSQARGRSYAVDVTRSRSQSLATTTRQLPIGSPFGAPGGAWPPMGDQQASAMAIPSAQRYSELKQPGSRYGSLGATHARSPVGMGGAGQRQDEISNISPFVRDVNQILLGEGSALRELWSPMNPPRDESGGGGSGTTSRRHSVSVVKPRREIVGFNISDGRGGDFGDDGPSHGGGLSGFSAFGRSARLTDDDLAADLDMLSLGGQGDQSSSYMHHRQRSSEVGSLPMHARTPSGAERLSGFQPPLNLQIPQGGSFGTRGALASPAEGAGSPRAGGYVEHPDTAYLGGNSARAPTQGLGARYVPGQGIQYPGAQGGMETLNVASPPSAGGFRSTGAFGAVGRAPPLSAHPAGVGHFPSAAPPQQLARRASDAGSAAGSSAFDGLGRGVPLSAVPSSWPLFIVEFKAGRTDLFYSTDLALNVRAGDLVIVEADRGKDLGKVVNDTITLAEVEAFQQQQQARAGWAGDGQSSAGGQPSGGKEINPKMIYGKASAHDAQVLLSKMQDEEKALQLCQQKVRQKKLPMEVIDAEYQWDRRKLTFYFIAEKRIDFRELVRELFRLYKTRIWMASLQGPGGFDQ